MKFSVRDLLWLMIVAAQLLTVERLRGDLLKSRAEACRLEKVALEWNSKYDDAWSREILLQGQLNKYEFPEDWPDFKPDKWQRKQ